MNEHERREVVNMCRRGGCCPVLVFNEDGSVSVSENERELVKLPRELADEAAKALLERGYGR
jgi:hypothetical protein